MGVKNTVFLLIFALFFAAPVMGQTKYNDDTPDPVSPYQGEGDAGRQDTEPTRVRESFRFDLRTPKDDTKGAKPDQSAAAEWLQFETTRDKEFEVSSGLRYEARPDGTVDVDVASMATGKGAEFRKWEVTDTKIDTESGLVRPSSYDNIYSTQESVFAKPAAVVFTALGAAYGIYADKCSSGGSTCPVTGGSAGGGVERGDLARGIDTAGLAVGLGLLTAQAKGEITGQRAAFNLTEEEARNIKGVKLVVEHRGTGKKKRIKVPIKGLPRDILKKLSGTVPSPYKNP